MLELYHYGDSLCSMKVRFGLFEKGVEFKSRYVDLLNWEHLTDKYKKLNPNAVVPTIVHPSTSRPAWPAQSVPEAAKLTVPNQSNVRSTPCGLDREGYLVKPSLCGGDDSFIFTELLVLLEKA